MSIISAASGKASGSEVSIGFRSGWVRAFRVALGSAGGAAVVLGLAALVHDQPEEGFRLLIQWGPWPIVVLVAMAVLGHFLSRINDSIHEAFGAVVSSVKQGVEAQSKTADALTRLADSNGRQGQEVERLATYAAQEVTGIYERMDEQDAMLRAIQTSLDEMKGSHGQGT